MTRDRLFDLREARGDTEDPTIEDVSISVDGTTGLDDFFKEVEEIRNMIDQIKDKVRDVKKKNSELLSSPHRDEKEKQEQDDMMAFIKKTATKARTKLKAFEDNIELKDNRASASYRMKKIQHATLSRSLVEVMTEYNAAQEDYCDRMKQRIQRQLEITGHKVTDEELDDMLEQDNPAVFTQGLILETQHARNALADIEARHEDIKKLENSIREVHDMFVNMAMLIESQGEMIDRIEHHVGQAVEYVAMAKEEVRITREYQSKARKKKLIIIGCILGLLLVLIIILAWNFS